MNIPVKKRFSNNVVVSVTKIFFPFPIKTRVININKKNTMKHFYVFRFLLEFLIREKRNITRKLMDRYDSHLQ